MDVSHSVSCFLWQETNALVAMDGDGVRLDATGSPSEGKSSITVG
jgi:hypothetical protein